MSIRELQYLIAATTSSNHTAQIETLSSKVDDVLKSQSTILIEHCQTATMVTRLLTSTNSRAEQVVELVQ